MTVTFYKFTKRENSTKQPTTGTGHDITCNLKEECSFMMPVLLVSPSIVSGTFSPNVYNYAYIPYWQRYYFITDWNYLNGVWEATLSVDVMASFKTEIGSTSSYIIRSSSNYNGDIIDGFYPTTSVSSTTKQQFAYDFIYQTSVSEGCFIVGFINNLSDAQFGAVTYYALTLSELTAVLTFLFSGNVYQTSNIMEIGEGLWKSIFNPFQYVVSCMWVPWAASTMSDTTSTVTVGYWNTSITGHIAKTLVKTFGYYSGLPITLHPQWSTRGFYLNKAPYSRYTLYFPPFGTIPIDSSFIKHEYEESGHGHNYLHGYIYCDCITGVADLYLSITDGYGSSADGYMYCGVRSAQIGVPVQLAQVTSDYMGAIIGGAQTLESAMSKDHASISGIFQGIKNGLESIVPQVVTSGSNGCLTEVMTPPLLICEHYQLVDENLSEFGRPLCATKTINTLSGYVQCGEADHPFSGTSEETRKINDFMRNGFYYE